MNFVRFAHREGVPQQVPDIQHSTLPNPIMSNCVTNMDCSTTKHREMLFGRCLLGHPFPFREGDGG